MPWLVFDRFRSYIWRKLPFLSLLEDGQDWCLLLNTSPIASVVVWFLYFTIDLILGTLKSFGIGYSTYGLVKSEKRKYPKQQLSDRRLKWCSCCLVKWVFLVDTSFSDKKNWTVFQEVLLSDTFLKIKLL